MTAMREEVLARYDPIRASIKRVLKLAEESCANADWTRAMKHVAPWAEPAALAEAPAPEMLTDIALFEPNQRGRRVFDRFLSDKASQRLSAPEFALARRMAGAVFSIFRFAERHEAGLWLEDLLRGGRRLWLVDRTLEQSASEGAVFGMRLFEADEFHAGFGIIVPPAEDMLEFCVGAAESGQRLPVRHSLAATLYGDALSATLPPGEAQIEMRETLLDLVAPDEPEPALANRGRRRAG
jgi:hypothetical protein